MLINYAFTGVLGEDDFPEKNDPMFKGKIASTIWVLLKEGKIESIEGLDKIKTNNDVIFVMDRFQRGDTVKKEWLGTERQIFARIYVVTDTVLELNTTITEFENHLKIKDEQGNNMILTWLEHFDATKYH